MNIRSETIPLYKIVLSERFRKDYGNIDELADSIKERGLLHPILVRPKGELLFELVAGGRRFAAIKRLGWTEVPVRIIEGEDELSLRTYELLENVMRKDLTWQEQVALTQEIHRLEAERKGNQTLEETADILGKSTTAVHADLKLAMAMEKNPQLKNIPKKAQALHVILKEEEELIKREIASRIEKRVKMEGGNAFKRRLVDSYLVGDTRKLLESVPDEHVDIIEMDPPYLGLDLTDVRSAEDNVHASMHGFHGNYTHEELVELHRHVLKHAFRILKQGGWLICWGSVKHVYDLMGLIREPGFNVREHPIIWIKDRAHNSAPEINLSVNYEFALYAGKGAARIHKPHSQSVINVRTPIPSRRIHPTEKPIMCMYNILEPFAVPGGRILCPFLGSGNTLIAAHYLNMTGFGFELNSAYKDSFVIRVKDLPESYSKLIVEETLARREEGNQDEC